MVAKAIAVRIKASVFFSTTNVATTRAPKEKPITNIIPGKPSRYITIKKLKYASAKPDSCCITESSAGDIAIAVAITCDFVLEKSVSKRDKYFAKFRRLKVEAAP